MKMASNGRPSGYSGTVAGRSGTAINAEEAELDHVHVMVSEVDDAGLSLPALTKSKPSEMVPESNHSVWGELGETGPRSFPAQRHNESTMRSLGLLESVTERVVPLPLAPIGLPVPKTFKYETDAPTNLSGLKPKLAVTVEVPLDGSSRDHNST
jgi:hypothetical protein